MPVIPPTNSGNNGGSSADELNDSDSDSLTNADEGKYGTDPSNPDSDSDGFSDGFEVSGGFDPLDAASHPFTEFQLNARGQAVGGARAHDQDSDGLPNSYEEEIGTSPEKLDTDGDGIADGIEVLNGSDPLAQDSTSNDASTKDSDGDGLFDSIESQLGTSPLSADFDRDGLSDPYEVLLGFNPGLPDTDGDGVLDGFAPRGALKYKFMSNKWKF